jgi:N-acetylglucosaminyldiphosphoundecaprenol N-acetyl-beta-D-mannosaminyltransferase
MPLDAPLLILGSRVDPVDAEQAKARILDLIRQRRFAQVVTFGSEMAMLARRDRAYRHVINEAALVVPDTIGIVYAARLLGRPLRERVAGVELVESVCRGCAQEGFSVFFVGGAPGVADQAAQMLSAKYPGLSIAGVHDGYFGRDGEPEVLAQIAGSRARLVLVALGFPRQELWVRQHAAELGAAVCMGIGGSLDVISGRLKRAPRMMRSLGLEWLYRLVKEPRRLGRQLALPQFAALVAAQALSQRRTARRETSHDL